MNFTEVPRVHAIVNTGNLSEADPGAPDRVYGTGNRLLQKGDTEYVWDDDGRLAAKRTRTPAGVEEVWRYRWDAAGLLKRVERPDGLMAEFAYDPFARRMSKRVTKPARGNDAASEVTTKFVWDGDVLVHELVARAEGLEIRSSRPGRTASRTGGSRRWPTGRPGGGSIM